MEKLLRNIWPGATEDQPVAAYDHAHSWPSLLQQQRSSLKYSRTVPIKVHTTPTERILLAGPFKCWPGSWVATILLVPEFERQAKVIGFTGDAVDEKQQPLPFPPLHMHHIHVAGGEYTHLWETHGDYNIVSTSDAAGHRTAGYTSRVSSPYCRQMGSTKLSVNAQVNDVRGDATGSGMAQSRHSIAVSEAQNHSSITWWLRIRFEMSTAPCRPAAKVVLWYPCDRSFCRHDLLKRFDVGNSPHGRVSWWATHAPVGGELVDAWLHSHRARYAGFVLARGHLEGPWLERIAALAQARESPGREKEKEKEEKEEEEEVAALRSMILDVLRQHDALVCHDDPAVGTFERRVETDGSVRHYDRQGRLECPSARPLIAGEPLTCLSFSANIWEADVDPFPQHLMFFANVANATATAPMYQGWARTYSYLALQPSNRTPAKAHSVSLHDTPLRVDEGEEHGRDMVNSVNGLVRPRWPPPQSP